MKTLGSRLRKARQTKGLSIQDVHDATKIRMVYLVAMEEDRFHELPGDAYVRGFLRSFAKVVGFEGDELVSEYDRLSEASEIKQTRVNNDKEKKIRRRPKGIRVIPFAVLGLLIVVLLIFASFLQKPKDTFDADNRIDTLALGDDSEDIQETTYENSEQQQDNEHINGHTPADVPASYEVAEFDDDDFENSHELIVVITERCWVRVVADGHRVFERTMLPGETETWKADHEIRIRLGNAGGADLTHNGIHVGPPGKSGDVIELVFPDHGT